MMDPPRTRRRRRIVDHPGVDPAAADHRFHIRTVEALHVEAHVLGGQEVDPEVSGRAAGYAFNDLMRDALELERRGSVRVEDPLARALVHDRLLVARRIPDLVAQGLEAVPGEPPVDHVGGDARHLVVHGQVARAVREDAVPRFHFEVTRVQEVVDVLRHLGLARVHRGHLAGCFQLRIRLSEREIVVLGVGSRLLLRRQFFKLCHRAVRSCRCWFRSRITGRSGARPAGTRPRAVRAGTCSRSRRPA